MNRSLLLLLGLFSFCQTARAVVVASGGPNNTAPSGQPYFNNIGTLNGASAIYLDNGWVLTANHVASSLPASVKFGGIDYTTEAGSFNRLTNSDPLDSTYTDMVLFRLSAPPALTSLSIASSTPTVGSPVMMIGNGRTQESTPTYWNRTVNPGSNNDAWVQTTLPLSNISGFKTNPTNEIRWGVNDVAANNVDINVGSLLAPINVISFLTQFDQSAYLNEAQAVSGDSGGGVFSFNGSSWELSGMMYAVSTYETQPGGSTTAVYGSQTAISDLSYYRSQILTIIPEPSSLVFALCGGVVLCRRRR